MSETVISSYTNISFSLWIKHANKNGTFPLIMFAGSDYEDSKRLAISSTATGNISFVWSDINKNLTTITSLKPTNDEMWHHLVITHDGENAKIYIDNVLSAIGTGPISLTNLPNKYVGGFGSPLGDITIPLWFTIYNNNYCGYIDELRVFNKALTENEIRYLFLYGNERYPDFEDFESLLYWYQEVGFESFFELPKDIGNDLNTLSAFIKLGNARGTLNLNDGNRAKECTLYPNKYQIQKITADNGSGNSEVWITNPFTSRNFGLKSSGNFVEIQYTPNRARQGKYNVISWKTIGNYLIFETNKIPGIDQISAGGYIYINRDNWSLGSPLYPLFFDRDFNAYTHT